MLPIPKYHHIQECHLYAVIIMLDIHGIGSMKKKSNENIQFSYFKRGQHTLLPSKKRQSQMRKTVSTGRTSANIPKNNY